jgi:uncharacterized membrane protein YccC
VAVQGGDEMDIQRIIDQYYTKTGRWMQNTAESQALPLDVCWRHAEREFAKGLAELRRLKPTQQSRHVRAAFETILRACQAGAKGRYDKAQSLAVKSGEFLAKYVKEVSRHGKS